MSASASPTYAVTATLGLPGPANAVAVYPLAKTVYIAGAIVKPLPVGWFQVLDTTTYKAVPFQEAAQPAGGYTGLAVNPIANRIYQVYTGAPTPSGVLQFQRASYTLPAPVVGPVPPGPQAVTVGNGASGVAVNPLTNRVYVTNSGDGTVSVIDVRTNKVTTTIPVGDSPDGVAVNPVTNRVYVAGSRSGAVTVIDGATNAVTATVPVGDGPDAVAVNPITHTVYVAGRGIPGPPSLSVITVQPT